MKRLFSLIKFTILIVGMNTAFDLSASTVSSTVNSTVKPKVLVLNEPLRLLLADLCLDLCDVQALAAIGSDGHEVVLTPKQLVELKKASIHVQVGLGVDEQHFQRIGNPLANILVLGDKLSPISLSSINSNSSAKMDPHFWLDPVRGQQALDLFTNELNLLPSFPKAVLNLQKDRLKADLVQLTSKIQTEAVTRKNRRYLSIHDAFSYFEDRFGLSIESFKNGGFKDDFSLWSMRSLLARFTTQSPVYAILADRDSGQARNLAKELRTKLIIVDVNAKSPNKSYSDWLWTLSRSILEIE